MNKMSHVLASANQTSSSKKNDITSSSNLDSFDFLAISLCIVILELSFSRVIRVEKFAPCGRPYTVLEKPIVTASAHGQKKHTNNVYGRPPGLLAWANETKLLSFFPHQNIFYPMKPKHTTPWDYNVRVDKIRPSGFWEDTRRYKRLNESNSSRIFFSSDNVGPIYTFKNN